MKLSAATICFAPGITGDAQWFSHYFRRLMVNAALFGSRDEHFARFLAAGQ
jgi:hypothetical protein